MEVEFWRGPLDGARQVIPDGTNLWIVHTLHPESNVKEFHVPGDAPAPETAVITDQHAYRITERFARESQARIFEYVGERVKK